MSRKRKIVVASAISIAALVLTSGWSVLAGDGWSPEPWQVYSPTGAWIVTCAQFAPGEIAASTIGPEDPRTGRYSWTVRHINGDPTLNGLCADADGVSEWFGTALRTGPAQSQATGIMYLTKKNQPRDIVTWIVVTNRVEKWVDADTFDYEATLSLYSAIEHPGHLFGNLPDQDKNNDGWPDEGQQPILCMPISGTCHRIGLMPPCEPTPMP